MFSNYRSRKKEPRLEQVNISFYVVQRSHYSNIIHSHWLLRQRKIISLYISVWLVDLQKHSDGPLAWLLIEIGRNRVLSWLHRRMIKFWPKYYLESTLTVPSDQLPRMSSSTRLLFFAELVLAWHHLQASWRASGIEWVIHKRNEQDWGRSTSFGSFAISAASSGFEAFSALSRTRTSIAISRYIL